MPSEFAALLGRAMVNERAAADYAHFYNGRCFTGGLWDERVASLPANSIGIEDIAFTSYLGMGIGGPKAKRGVVTPWGVGEILKQSNDAASLLRLIPGDLELQDVDEAEFHGQDGPMDAARTLWYLTAKALGTNEKKTISTWKVLAGKRPHLFPVRDTDVLRALRTPRGWWKEWWQTLSFDPGLVKRARDIHATSTAVPASPSVLRICDVVVWMSAADRGTCGQH